MSATHTNTKTQLLRLSNVGKTYRMGDVDVPVLHDINLEIYRGELLVIVGPSGSGKSTLLNLLGGLDTPTEGKVWFQEQELGSLSETELTSYRREHLGFVFQFYNLVSTLTARENVLVTTEICRDAMDATEVLKLVGLDHRIDHFPAQLSGGEQQRVAIARAVAKKPELLLCDEPTGALDLETGRRILGVLRKLNRELNETIVIITHNSAIAEMADRCIHLGSGSISEIIVQEQPLSPEEITW